ncbi:MAG: DUF4167 domain-containing protein [Marivita sp.]|uniref:DUF4167 domain-containing protein n=1 Tax=Marivita sp. TaxID=2003365 RepID=UPI003EFA6FFB
MRSSNKRSRNKNNRSRPNTVGNVVNRVFDSSGPEGKVRGTPQQIIDKYNQLARDAQLSNDRVNAENFQQHAEHYMRLLSEAQREQDARREQQERENRDRQQQRDSDRGNRPDQDQQPSQASHNHNQNNNQNQPQSDPAHAPQPDILETAGDDGGDSGLVETPEAKAEEKPKKPRAPRKPRKKPEPQAETQPEQKTPDAAE